jgi:hypothetical protein
MPPSLSDPYELRSVALDLLYLLDRAAPNDLLWLGSHHPSKTLAALLREHAEIMGKRQP